MKAKNAWIAIGTLALIAGGSQTGLAQKGDAWDELGCVEVGKRPDRDVVPVGRRDGRYKAIRLAAAGNDVRIENLTVIYGNGSPDDIPVRAQIRQGQATGPIDLKGRDRVIDRIEIVSKRDFRGPGKGPARICISGLQDDRRPPQLGPIGKWEELGCKKVWFLADKDVIQVGRREGRFKAIRLDVTGNSVFVMNLRVVYANGQPDDIPIKSEIRAGGQSGPLDLKGSGRAIDKIELIHRAKPSLRGSAKVCVSGRS